MNAETAVMHEPMYVIGTLEAIMRKIRAAAVDDAKAPAQPRPDTAPVVGRATSRIKRLYLAQLTLQLELQKIAAEEAVQSYAYNMQHNLSDLIGRHLQHEVWLQFPALFEKQFGIASDWTLYEKEAVVKQLTLVTPVPTEWRSTRSADVGIGKVRGLSGNHVF